MTWAEGYVSEVDYTFGYYRELSPNLLRLRAPSAGVATSFSSEVKYLELGFGQGTLNQHSCGCRRGRILGTDFNPKPSRSSKVPGRRFRR